MLIQWENKSHRVPDFLVIGAAKSGTTTVYEYLSGHPKVFFPKFRKEPFYFSFGNKQPGYSDAQFVEHLIWNASDYLSLYAQAPSDALCADASTSYLYTAEQTIENIKALYGDQAKKVKIIAILRHPAERAFSHYTYLIRNGHENLSFTQAIQPSIIAQRKNIRWGYDYLQYGMYAQQLMLFKDFFDEVKVFLFEDIKDPKTFSEQLFSFLQINPVELSSQRIANPSGIPKNKTIIKILRGNFFTRFLRAALPSSLKNILLVWRDKLMQKNMTKQVLDKETREDLVAYYLSEINALEKLIQRDLSHWKK